MSDFEKEFFAENFLELTMQGYKYLSESHTDLIDEIVSPLRQSFSVIANLSEREDMSYTLSFLELICPHGNNEGVLACLEDQGIQMPQAPENIEEWKRKSVKKLAAGYSRWRKLSRNRVLSHFVLVAPNSWCGLAGILQANPNSQFPPPHQISGKNHHRDIIHTVQEAKQLVKNHLVVREKIPIGEIEKSLKTIEIEWDRSLLRQFKKAVDGKSFSFLFVALFLTSAMQNLAKNGVIKILEKNSNREISIKEVLIPNDASMTGAFNNDEIEYICDPEEEYSAVSAIRVEGIVEKLNIARDINRIWFQFHGKNYFNRFLLPAGNYGEITQDKEDDRYPLLVPVSDSNALVTSLFPDWTVLPTQISKTIRSCEVENKPIKVYLNTYDSVCVEEKNSYSLGWVDYFENRRIKNPKDWQDKLFPELRHLKNRICRERADKNIELIAKALLSVGFAFGYVFSQPSGFQLSIEQHNYRSGSNEKWHTWEKLVDAPTNAEFTEVSADKESEDLYMSVSITHDILSSVESYLQSQNLSINHRLDFSVEKKVGRNSILDNGHALGIARNISEAIARQNDKYRYKKIHLFYSGPLALAVFIGHYLNACGSVQLYEFSNIDGNYSPSFLLQS